MLFLQFIYISIYPNYSINLGISMTWASNKLCIVQKYIYRKNNLLILISCSFKNLIKNIYIINLTFLISCTTNFLIFQNKESWNMIWTKIFIELLLPFTLLYMFIYHGISYKPTPNLKIYTYVILLLLLLIRILSLIGF